MTQIISAGAASVSAMLFCAASAQAHVTIVEGGAKSGATVAAYFRVSHGCGASPTTALRIEIPPDVTSAKPQPMAGWTLEVERAPLAAPRRGAENASAARVTAVTWRGRLEADQFDQFGLLVGLPKREGPVYFPAIQTCETGEERWEDIPSPNASGNPLRRPAPVVILSDHPTTGGPQEHDMSSMNHNPTRP